MARKSKLRKRNLIARLAQDQKAGPMKSDKKRELEKLRTKEAEAEVGMEDVCFCGTYAGRNVNYCPLCGSVIL